MRGIAHRVRSLELGVGGHVEHAHIAQLLCRFAGRLEVPDVERLQLHADRFEVILGLGSDRRADLFGETDQIDNAAGGGRLTEYILKLGEQDRLQTLFDIGGAVGALRADHLCDELLRIFHLEGVGAKALKQRHAQSHAGVADDDRLGRAPFLVGKFPHGDKEHFGRKGRPVVEELADEID